MTTESRLRCSLIIPTLNRETDLVNAVASVLEQTRKPEELIVVDAGSDPSLKERLTQQVSGCLDLIYVPSDPGLTHQRNVGILASSGDVIAFIDDDSVIEPEYIEEIMKAFEEDATHEVAAVCGRIVNVSQSKMPQLFTRLFLLGDQGSRGILKKSGYMSSPYGSTTKHYVRFLSGGVMSFRRGVFDYVKFDENLRGWATMEDVDIARQIFALGKQILYVPSARQEHYPSGVGRLNRAAILEMSIRNHHYLFTKHHSGALVEKIAFIWSLIGLGIVGLWRGGYRGYVKAIRNVLIGESIRYKRQDESQRGVWGSINRSVL